MFSDRRAVFVLMLACSCAALRAEPGLAVVMRQGENSDRVVLPFAALHVEATNAPSRFLKPGPFTAEVAGWISVDLRAQYSFTVEASTGVELLINGKEIVAIRAGATSVVSKPVRLNKGTNSFLLRLAEATNASAFRVLWSSRNTPVAVPIPPGALSHTPDSELQRSLAEHGGAFAFEQYRCANCHLTQRESTPDSPAFAGIGSRLHADWMARWTLLPAGERSARMPAMFHGEDAEPKARAVAVFLATLVEESSPESFSATDAMRTAGETLFNDLHCVSCHTLPSEPAVQARISLRHVKAKFLDGALSKFLENPQAHYLSNPMPNFKLSVEETRALATFLSEPASAKASAPPDAALVAKGKELIQASGCLNCHTLDLPNQFTAPLFEKEMPASVESGCLDPNSTHAPRFAFTSEERAGLKAFLEKRRASPVQIGVAHENAVGLTRSLQCVQCHQDAGLPDPLILGGKLKPEWAKRFVAGEVPYKPRPWLKARMPAFQAHAGTLASGLAAIHGYASESTAEPAPDRELVALGAKLVSSSVGFSCVACHPVGSASTAIVVESPGVNLAYVGERLLSPFFHRWLMNPIAIDPATKMPVYFDAEGRSQLTEFFGGDASKQIEAIWHYLRMGEKMPAPPTP